MKRVLVGLVAAVLLLVVAGSSANAQPIQKGQMLDVGGQQVIVVPPDDGAIEYKWVLKKFYYYQRGCFGRYRLVCFYQWVKEPVDDSSVVVAKEYKWVLKKVQVIQRGCFGRYRIVTCYVWVKEPVENGTIVAGPPIQKG